jgi:hypothetical protein
MAITLYDATVAAFAQTLGAVEGFLGRGLAHCQDTNLDPQELIEARLYGDMLPLRYQVQAAIGHSVGAITGCRTGIYAAPMGDSKIDYQGLQKAVADARTALKAFTPDEVNALEAKDVVFKLPNMEMPFTGEGILMTFAIPNFHFHCTTAYDILRSKGVPLGKRDYLGRIRLKT